MSLCIYFIFLIKISLKIKTPPKWVFHISSIVFSVVVLIIHWWIGLLGLNPDGICSATNYKEEIGTTYAILFVILASYVMYLSKNLPEVFNSYKKTKIKYYTIWFKINIL